MLRIIEVANNLGVSKVTVYKKISALKPEIKEHLVKAKNITYITEAGYNLIKESLKNSHFNRELNATNVVNHDLQNQCDTQEYHLNRVLESYLKDLMMTYDYLKSVARNRNDRLSQIQLTSELLRKLCKIARNEGAGGNNG